MPPQPVETLISRWLASPAAEYERWPPPFRERSHGLTASKRCRAGCRRHPKWQMLRVCRCDGPGRAKDPAGCFMPEQRSLWGRTSLRPRFRCEKFKTIPPSASLSGLSWHMSDVTPLHADLSPRFAPDYPAFSGAKARARGYFCALFPSGCGPPLLAVTCCGSLLQFRPEPAGEVRLSMRVEDTPGAWNSHRKQRDGRLRWSEAARSPPVFVSRGPGGAAGFCGRCFRR